MTRIQPAPIPRGRPLRAAFVGTGAGLISVRSFLTYRTVLSFLSSIAGVLPLPVHAIQFPDTADLKKDYKVSARTAGRPTGFFRIANGDSSSLHLEWSGSAITTARLEQEEEYASEPFSTLTAEYGNGAAWHESMTAPDAQTLKLYPGIQQHWHLKGFAGEKGWLGSGVHKSRYFLVFRSTPPTATAVVFGPLRLNAGVFTVLDTSSQWLHIPCKGTPKSAKTGSGPFCFSPSEDSRLIVRIDRKKPLSLQAWLEEGESAALNDIKKALKAIPDAGQVEYAKDLSEMLLGEGQAFLVKFSQRLPEAFNWPSWQIQDLGAGRVPTERFLPLIRRQANPGDSLPAFHFENPGLRLTVNLYYRGMVHLIAEEPREK